MDLTPSDAVRDVWRPGARVGDYLLTGLLGRGAMGEVFRARHAGTGAEVAIKCTPAGAGPELLERFLREGQALASVGGHPHVLPIHTVGRAGGRAYLVMALAEGGTLEERLRREGRLPPAEAARLALALAEGLGHVHAQGVVHRDLKPANVLFDERGSPLLVDFGVAALAGAQGLTRTGEVLGTPLYMAPEQALGDRERQGPWSDVYGLGAILYQLLTGAPPFPGRSAVEVLQRVIQEPPRSPRELAPDVPPALEAVCLRALAKEPRDRYPDGAALARALRQLDRDPPGVTGPRRRALLLALLGSALLGALVALKPGAVRPPAPGQAGPARPTAEPSPREAPDLAESGPDPAPSPEAGGEPSPGADAEELDEELGEEEAGDDEDERTLKKYTAILMSGPGRQSYEEAARQGDLDAWVRLGYAAQHGLIEPGGLEASRGYYRRAAEAGHAEAMYRLGRQYFHQPGRDLVQARRWLMAAAEAGFTKALQVLGEVEKAGRYGVSPSKERALEVFLKGAQLGDRHCACEAGGLLLDLGGPDAARQARELYLQAAAAGHGRAAYYLGRAYLEGKRLGLASDPVEAAKWLRRSAAARSGDGLEYLIERLQQGQLAPESPDELELLRAQLARLRRGVERY